MRVALGLSGGVDSAVSAALLQEQGYEVTGVFMVCFSGPGCRSDEDRKDALDVALKLKIPFEVLDFRKEYQEKVLSYFYREYQIGRTPNPDVMCNREIKFGMFYDWALKHGFDYVATGHYARISECQSQQLDLDVLDSRPRRRGSGCARQSQTCCLCMGMDQKKDQSYFLYQLREEQLHKILFPIGGMTKSEVRKKAKEWGLSVADKPDSQGICFIGEVSAKKFLEERIKPKKGLVVNTTGKEIGTHDGVEFLTVGQRHGFTVNVKNANSPPLYVIDKDMEKNELVVGIKEECLRDSFEVETVYWINGQPLNENLQVRIRHLGEMIPSTICDLGSKISVQLSKSVFGVAPGQAAVFYQDDVCLGGGVVDI